MLEGSSKKTELLGALLRADGAVTEDQLSTGLAEQARAGGRLGEILVARGVDRTRVRDALAGQLGMATAQSGDEPTPLLSSSSAHRLHAVALDTGTAASRTVPVAMSDPSPPVLDALAAELQRPVEPRLADAAHVDEMLRTTYGEADVAELSAALREQRPLLSASEPVGRLFKAIAAVLAVAVVAGLVIDLTLTLTVLVAAATAFYVATTALRIFVGARGWREGSAFDPTPDDLTGLVDGDLPTYTILVPLYGEKEATLRVLFAALAEIDYPKHKLDCLLLLEEADEQTRAAVDRVGCPAWFRRIVVPAGGPQTKPMAMAYGLRTARGEFVTIYDAEDKPDPLQLKRAICALRQGGPRLACLQAKLAYYNSRQNLLTRLFTLEYDAWFNLFLPGFARMGAPLPLGGTSNHFRRDALDECLAWDPYNVTEDADLGVRLARSGWQVGLLESTTEEEANSRVGNWLRQRSRWVKGYLQTFLVHFRQPRRLAREIGLKPTLILALTMGGSVLTALMTPIFWGLVALWFLAEPAWLQEIFPGPIFYPALASLLIGNFALIFFALVAAVGRGHDDLALASICMPVYWLLMSVATYLAVVELVRRPYHWHKTEHGLHFGDPEAAAA